MIEISEQSARGSALGRLREDWWKAVGGLVEYPAVNIEVLHERELEGDCQS